MIRSLLSALFWIAAAFLPASGKPAATDPVANPKAVVTAGPDNPVADPAAVIVAGNARFTLLTPRLVRMEWAEDGRFEDRASLAILNRRLPVPHHTVTRNEGQILIATDSLRITYSGQEIFSPENLEVTFMMNGKPKKWHPGMDDSANLMGTARTLDGFNGTNRPRNFDKGLLSRDGWALVDESARCLLEKVDADWGAWVCEREPGIRLDYYLFAYGHDYKAALGDFIRVAGRIPLPPKYAFGYWWTRFWQYSDFEFVELAKTIRSLGIPADVMILDMDWHERYGLRKFHGPKDMFGNKDGWTGYDWQKQLFPAPDQLLADLHDLHFKTSLNLHLCQGINPRESHYEDFVKGYLSRTKDYDGPENYIFGEGGYQFKGYNKKMGSAGEKAPVPYRLSDRAWADTYFETILHPIQRQGVDFWWLDWQQWLNSKYVSGLNNTFWHNHVFFNDMLRQTVHLGKAAPRAMIYHRWGGLGSHRYPVGFSGDTQDEWAVLDYQPYFTSTASNVGFGYWGHDLGGLVPGKRGPHPTDPEMYTRWLQYGVFTPIFRTHWNKSEITEKRIWMHPDHFLVMKDAIRLRYTLSNYISNAAREAYDSGICICRPLYYDAPEDERAYTYSHEYLFGDDILATNISTPADSITQLSSKELWFPEGNDWYGMATGEMYPGGASGTHYFTISEIPWYVKAGSILPLAADDIMNLQENSNILRLLVVPGDGTTELSYYEDDGSSQAYPEDYATTRITKTSDTHGATLTIWPRIGKYAGMDPKRTLSVTFEGVFPPEEVFLNGKKVAYARRRPAEGTPWWTYDGSALAWTLYIPEEKASRKVTVRSRYNEATAGMEQLLRGKKGRMRRIMGFTDAVKRAYCQFDDPFQVQPKAFLDIAQCASYITEDPAHIVDYLQAFDMDAMIEAISANKKLPSWFKERTRAMGKLY